MMSQQKPREKQDARRSIQSWNCVTRDVMKTANLIPENTRRSFAITMVFVIMTPRSATSFRLTGSTFSQLATPWKIRGSDRSALLRMPKGTPKSVA
eukprot:15355240-Ditylum_brightwellii.AAC.1